MKLSCRNPFCYRSSFIRFLRSGKPLRFLRRNPFCYRSSFIRNWIEVIRICREGRNPFCYRSSFIQELNWNYTNLSGRSQSLLLQVFVHTAFKDTSLKSYRSRNPFCYRSSFIPQPKNILDANAKVAIPSVTGLRSYATLHLQSAWIDVAIPSVTGLRSYIHRRRRTYKKSAGRNPFYYRSSFIRMHYGRCNVCLWCRNPFYYRSSFIQRK